LFAQDPVVVLEHEIMYGKTMEISQAALGHDFVIPFGKVTSVSGASERASERARVSELGRHELHMHMRCLALPRCHYAVPAHAAWGSASPS
jgi:hypothetical protein